MMLSSTLASNNDQCWSPKMKICVGNVDDTDMNTKMGILYIFSPMIKCCKSLNGFVVGDGYKWKETSACEPIQI